MEDVFKSGDRPATTVEIEITPEMVEAEGDVLLELGLDSSDRWIMSSRVAKAVYIAMQKEPSGGQSRAS